MENDMFTKLKKKPIKILKIKHYMIFPLGKG